MKLDTSFFKTNKKHTNIRSAKNNILPFDFAGGKKHQTNKFIRIYFFNYYLRYIPPNYFSTNFKKVGF